MLKDKVILLNQTKEFKRYRDADIAKLLKLIVLDGETDLKCIASKMLITQKVIEKYLSSKEILLQYLNDDEYNEFLEYYSKLTNFLSEIKVERKQEPKRVEKKEETERLVKNIVSDIMYTRLSKEQILIRNCISDTIYDRIINNEELLESIFGKGFCQVLRNRIKQKSIMRASVPRNMYLVEEREDLSIVKDDIIYINEFDFKRMKIVSCYISNDFDIELVSKEKNLMPISIINSLLSEKNKEILKTHVYELVQKLANLEKILLTGVNQERKEIVSAVIMSLEKNNYDISMVSQELQMPIALIKNCLKQPFITIIYSKEQIEQIKEILNSEELRKPKGM